MKTLRKILLIVLSFFGIATFVASAYCFFVTSDVKLSPEKLILNEKTVCLYDYEGVSAKSLSTALLKQTTPISECPEQLKNAFIDTEDKRFYRHSGYDFRRIARAALNNLKANSFKEGASTISQQLIKNTHLTQEKTLKRKLQEWKLTKELEHRYDKDEILEKYLNSIYFGHSCFGITSAANFYFGKSPKDLSLAESAILAGLVKSPNHYSPFKNPENCQKRKAVVLNVMLKSGSITEKEKNEALNAPLPTSSYTNRDEGYAHFVFDELTTLSEKHSFKVGGKIEIYTYLDPSVQKSLEEIAQGYTESDKTLLVLDGEIKGFKGCVSTVGNICRLPGSLIKPLLVYAPAIEENVISPATPIHDCKVDYNGYAPENYDGVYHGYVSARECVEKSLNVPAVKTLDSLTLKKATKYLEKLRLHVSEEDKTLALALGGMKKGYTLKDMLSAYSALQNNGTFTSCGFISSVRINGVTVYKKPTEKERVFSEESAYLMTDMLKSTAKDGTAKKLRSLPFEIAAKTGTVGTQKGNTDAYALSYTTKDCAAVWLGNADNGKINCTGGGTPCSLLYEINQALGDIYKARKVNIDDFKVPKNIVRVELDKPAYYDTHTLLLADDNAPTSYRISELFKKSAIPLNKSDSFSNPNICAPTISTQNNTVLITFDERLPRYYTYKIERHDYASHTTLYEGKFLSKFIDDTLIEGSVYVYTVTPIYNGVEGATITLPSVSVEVGEKVEIGHDKILSKDWWEN